MFGYLRKLPIIPLATMGTGLGLIRVGHPGAGRLAAGLAVLYAVPWIWVLLRSGRSRREIAIRCIACTLAVLVGISVFELPALFQIIDYRILFASPIPPWQRPSNRPDPELIYLKKGHQRIRESFTGNETHWLRDTGPAHLYHSDRQYDRDGFRNPRDLGQADVVVLGDSFIEGAHVAEDELINSRLGAELGEQKKVVNLGQAGYGPPQELHVLRRFGITRRPKVCVWAFYEGNDLADIGEYETQYRELAECLREGRGMVPSFGDRSFTVNALNFVLRTWIDPAPRRPASQYRGWFTDARGHQIPLYFASGDHRREEVVSGGSQKSLDRLREILRDAHDLCRNQGIRLIVAFIPTKLRVYRPVCTFEEGSLCAKWPRDELPRMIGELVGGIASDLEYVDSTPFFQAEAARGALLYLPDDTHWSAEGHRSAAQILAKILRRGDHPPQARDPEAIELR